MNTAGDAWHEALRRLDKLAEVYTGSARIEEIRSWVERGGDGAAEAVDALTGGLVPDTDPDSVVGGLPDGAIRYCDWPGCMDRVDTINGPVANGWRQTRRLLLCPDHSVREHWADYFKTEDGADAAGVWCTCGHRWNERPVNLNVLRAWWQQHVGTLGTQPSTDTVQAPDEMEEHFVDANERLGEALVEIGMAIGLPRPTAQFHWGAPEILARIAEYDRIQVWVCDVEGHAEIPCRRCHLGAEGKPTPLYRYSGPRRTGQVADPMDDLARLDSMIAAAPADYPGLPLIRRHRDEVRALLGTDTTPDRLAWIGTAAETAAVERQARYQETACARRPAEERPDA